MKKLRICLAALIAAATFILPAQAAFSDVPSGHWGAADINRCCDMGLMVGTAANKFSPSATLTVAEAVSVSVRLYDFCTGSETDTNPYGGKWYEGAVRGAIELGIMDTYTFDSYTRPATRAELAGLLGNALPQEYYEPINRIKELPDVDAYTPYAEEIFRLYEAGILAGGDQYGTFSPYQNISRAEIAAMLCRLANEDARVTFTLLKAPADATVRASASRLLIGNLPVYGVVEIDGRHFIPANVLDDANFLPSGLIYYDISSQDCTLSISPYRLYEGSRMIPQTIYPVPGTVLGMAEPSAISLWYEGETLTDAIYTIGGRYPMICLEAIGAERDGNDFVLLPEENFSVMEEPDLIGTIPTSLKKSTNRETVIAIHDYLVNRLKYDPLTNSSYSSQAEMEKVEQLFNQYYDIYSYGNSITLATNYGVCQNYAELFQTFCNRLGIPCEMVTGMGNGGSHAWNIVYVDGKWLYVDCTFDDPLGAKPTLSHDYCLVGTDTMVKRHWWEGADYPMPAEYDPAWEQLDPNRITSADMFRKCLVAQLMQGKTSFSLRTIASGAYGGTGCIYNYPVGFWQMRYGYNSSTGTYDFTVQY